MNGFLIACAIVAGLIVSIYVPARLLTIVFPRQQVAKDYEADASAIGMAIPQHPANRLSFNSRQVS
jgi:hypothetical protein